MLEVLPSATHVHFACHGGGRFFDPLLSAALSLSSEEPLSAREVAGLEISARLVVASACETGVPQGYYEVDESLGLSHLHSWRQGRLGVVSTLWQVDDFATALIMSKFYEGIFPIQHGCLLLLSAKRSSGSAICPRRSCHRRLRIKSGTACGRCGVAARSPGSLRRNSAPYSAPVLLGGVCIHWCLRACRPARTDLERILPYRVTSKRKVRSTVAFGQPCAR